MKIIKEDKMIPIFLQELPANWDPKALEAMGGLGGAFAGGMFGALAAFILAFLVVILIIFAALYVYTSLAFMAIGKKTKYPTPGLAWIPAVGPALITSSAAKMHWWPILLMIGAFIPIVQIFAMLAFAVFMTIWMWKTFEAIGKPGWWVLLNFIPLAGSIVFLILLGIAAWSKK